MIDFITRAHLITTSSNELLFIRRWHTSQKLTSFRVWIGTVTIPCDFLQSRSNLIFLIWMSDFFTSTVNFDLKNAIVWPVRFTAVIWEFFRNSQFLLTRLSRIITRIRNICVNKIHSKPCTFLLYYVVFKHTKIHTSSAILMW